MKQKAETSMPTITSLVALIAVGVFASACGGPSPKDVCKDWSSLMAVDMAVSPEMTSACEVRVEKMKQDRPDEFKRYGECVKRAFRAWLDKTKESKAAKQDLIGCESP